MLEEWKLIHPEHYGEELDYSYWHTQRLYFEAIEGKKIIGGLIGEFFGGVLYIPEIIVAKKNRGKNIGGSLIKKAENWVKTHRGHEVFLYTGKNWTEKIFYLTLGYQIVSEVPRFYSKIDFVLMRKFLD
ncbi:hypothetical protein A2859_02375 [Candidatus Roizmanbacteria bacterium RIFCSPHIGHO2_01_FULL_37_16b]|nr:MAG: hypothetical protein A2859_02375 [Candidatus Roizmanbacteria bacterium RIFCSPHIGHO2_01_FULL_37_16b]